MKNHNTQGAIQCPDNTFTKQNNTCSIYKSFDFCNDASIYATKRNDGLLFQIDNFALDLE
ncbi:hypothetical protein BB561_005297 [Smittium simulii]|uniref:Uncharacterized protein n=1 Tax=Smittium simulii TaxID=133385 RepID=A0A2T9YB04_9FUNG|nr:hypothetical protein BB561_005297 [Smittium simulii]